MRAGFELLKPYRATTFGSAVWMDARGFRRLKISGRGVGPFLGYHVHVGTRGNEVFPIFANDPGHILTVAPTRSGKGASQIIPNLLSWRGSAIVLDVKGENYDLTGAWRFRELGQNVHCFAPFQKHGARWNPLDPIVSLAAGPDAEAKMQDAVALLTELMFVPPTGSGSRDPFWQNCAKQLVQGIVFHVCTSKVAAVEKQKEKLWLVRERTMAEMRRLLTLEPESFIKLINEMSWSKLSWVREAASTAETMMKAEKQWVGVLTEAIDQTAVWGYERVKRATEKSDFNFASARDNKTTIYLCIPPEYIRPYRALLRVLTGCAMMELKNSYNGNKDELPVLMILDEFPVLQHVQPIEDSLAYLAGYGVKMWFFIQDLGQFQHHYPTTWRTFVANCGVRCFFGVSDFDTAKLVSDMSGQSTVLSETIGESVGESRTRTTTDGTTTTQGGSSSHGGSSGHGGSGSHWGGGSNWSTSRSSSVSDSYGTTIGSSRSRTHAARALITPGEVMCMNEKEQIIFIRGELPILAWQLRWYQHPDMKQRAAIMPSFWDTWTIPPITTADTTPAENPEEIKV